MSGTGPGRACLGAARARRPVRRERKRQPVAGSGAGGALPSSAALRSRSRRTCFLRVVVSVLPLPPLVPRGYHEATTTRRNQCEV